MSEMTGTAAPSMEAAKAAGKGKAVNRKTPKPVTMARRRARTGYMFILPFIIGFILFMVKPMILSHRMAFSETDAKEWPNHAVASYYGIDEIYGRDPE